MEAIPTEATYELTTRECCERYGLENNYSTFHNRITKLNITPRRIGRKSYLNHEQIKLLDRLHEHLANGGTFRNFIISEEDIQPLQTSTEETNITPVKTSNQIAINNAEIINALQALATSNRDILTPQKTLKEAAENNFLLTTQQVSSILNLSTSTISRWSTGTKKLGFIFHKEHDGGVLWRVKQG